MRHRILTLLVGFIALNVFLFGVTMYGWWRRSPEQIGYIQGKVALADGRPIRDAVIECSPKFWTMPTLDFLRGRPLIPDPSTGDDGAYGCGGPAGMYRLKLSSSQFAQGEWSTDVEIMPQKTVIQDLVVTTPVP